MSEKLSSEGKCSFCNDTYAQRGIVRHLNTHLKKLEKESTSKKEKSFLVYVKADIMFLCLWVDGEASFGEVDSFLRSIWLECCGHMSAFTDKDAHYKPSKSSDSFFESSPNEVPLDMKVSKVFNKGKKLTYDYDFGTTTRLNIAVKEEFSFSSDEKIVLLSRNEPIKILCDACKKDAASEICSVHLWDGNGFFCKSCAKKHRKVCEDFDEYAQMNLVNSPRTGMCGYDGGSIDLERDGIYKTTK
jgi:hypothetical protein